MKDMPNIMFLSDSFSVSETSSRPDWVSFERRVKAQGTGSKSGMRGQVSDWAVIFTIAASNEGFGRECNT